MTLSEDKEPLLRTLEVTLLPGVSESCKKSTIELLSTLHCYGQFITTCFSDTLGSIVYEQMWEYTSFFPLLEYSLSLLNSGIGLGLKQKHSLSFLFFLCALSCM